MPEPANISTTSTLLRWGVALLLAGVVLAMSPHTDDPTGHIKVLVIQAAAAILLLTLLIGFAIEGRPVQVPRLLGLPIAAFLAVNLAAASFSDYSVYSLVEFSMFVSLGALFFVAGQIYRTPRQATGLALAVCLSVAAASAYGFAQKFGYDPFPWTDTTVRHYQQLPASFGNPNVAGHVMILAFLCAVYLSTIPRFRWCIALAGLFLVHEYLTGHRAGLVALGAAGLVVAIAVGVRKWGVPARRAIAVALTMSILTALIGVAGGALILEARTGRPAPLDPSLLIRYNAFYGAARMITERPALGFGPGVYLLENPAYWTPYEQEWFNAEHMMNKHVHNDLIEFAVDGGVLAPALYLLIFVAGVAGGLALSFRGTTPETRRLGLLFAAVFTAFAVDGLFGFNIRKPVSALILFLLAGALSGLYTPEPREGRPVSWAGYSFRLAGALVAVVITWVGWRAYRSETAFAYGKAFAEAQRYEEAEARLAEGERLAPWDWRLPRQLGMARYDQRDFASAIEHLERSLARNPNWFTTLLPLADSAYRHAMDLRNGAPHDADAALEKSVRYAERAVALNAVDQGAAELYARNAYALAAHRHQLGIADPANSLKDWQTAERAVRHVLAFKVKRPAAYEVMLAEALEAQRKYFEATERLVQAVRLEPGEDAYWNAFYIHVARHSLQDMLRSELTGAIDRADKRHSGEPAPRVVPRLWLAKVEEEVDHDFNNAARYFSESADIAPEDGRVWERYSGFARRTSRLDEFKGALLAAYRTLVERGRTPPAGMAALAAAWSGSSWADGAAQLLAAVEVAGPDAGRNVAWAADLLLAELETRPAELADNAPAALVLGKVYARLGYYDVASNLFAAASPYLDGNEGVECARLLAETLERAGHTDRAIALLEGTVSDAPGQLALRLLLARALAKTGDAAGAAEQYRTILRSPELALDERPQIQAELDRIIASMPPE